MEGAAIRRICARPNIKRFDCMLSYAKGATSGNDRSDDQLLHLVPERKAEVDFGKQSSR